MKLLDPNSLARTLDAVNDLFFHERNAAPAQRLSAAKWLASRQGQAGSYFGLPAPMPSDFSDGARLFTGEKIVSRARIAHALGQEACRALILLGTPTEETRFALQRATRQIISRIDASRRLADGLYCCGTCSCALWRHLAAGGLDRQQRRLSEGLKTLKALRTRGGWLRFPFYYTLLTLSEIDLPAARAELRHARTACENRLAWLSHQPDDTPTQRRRDLLQRLLAL